MDEGKKAEWEGWIKRAISDYNSAKKLIDGDEKYLDTAVYHCQQAAEKILKSFLVYKDIQFEKVHSIVYLLNQCAKLEKGFEKFYEAAEILTPYATAFRYLGDFFEPKIEDADEALGYAKEIINFVISIYLKNKDYENKLVE